MILGIDPGTHCGWAVRSAPDAVTSGVWNLSPGRHEGGGMRFVRLRSYLDMIFAAYHVQCVAYEEVRRHLGTDAAHCYGGIVAVLTEECETRGIPYRAVPVGTVKKLATGKGNADKAAMLAAAEARWPGVAFASDDEADARWIAEALASEIGGAR